MTRTNFERDLLEDWGAGYSMAELSSKYDVSIERVRALLGPLAPPACLTCDGPKHERWPVWDEDNGSYGGPCRDPFHLAGAIAA